MPKDNHKLTSFHLAALPQPKNRNLLAGNYFQKLSAFTISDCGVRNNVVSLCTHPYHCTFRHLHSFYKLSNFQAADYFWLACVSRLLQRRFLHALILWRPRGCVGSNGEPTFSSIAK